MFDPAKRKPAAISLAEPAESTAGGDPFRASRAKPAVNPEHPTARDAENPPASKHQLLFLQGLRGLAALGVVLFHFTTCAPAATALPSAIPSSILWVIAHFNRGVELFFVLSGFVMAYSQRRELIGPSYVARFIARRSLRLDPTYWLTLLLMWGLSFASVSGAQFTGRPVTVGDWLANLFYLPVLTQRPLFLIVVWTLCYEVQFYIALTVLTGVGQRLSPQNWQRGYAWVFAPLTCWSLATWAGFVPQIWPGLFVDRWFMFMLGMTACWAWQSYIRAGWFWMLVLAAAATIPFTPYRSETIAAVVCATAIAIVGELNGLEGWLSWRPLQFLGAVSYSLYLLHLVVGGKVLTIGDRLAARRGHQLVDVPWVAVLIVLAAIAASIAAAWAMHKFVERPCMLLAKRIKITSRPAGAPQPALAKS